MYAIIDVETTGGNPKKDRVMEIGVWIHNGDRPIAEYGTLINPQSPISPFVSVLTGINEAMVAEAPTFAEVADHIIKITEGRVFVAHNVRFDYTFLVNEFKRLGIRFNRRQLCTVNLSRRVLPGMNSYSLGRLCEQVGIPHQIRHRAFGDAGATAELFHLLLSKDSKSIMAETLKQTIKDSLLPPNIKREEIDELPEEVGVYYFRDERGKILYIGKSTNIRERVMSHFRGDMNTDTYHELKSKMHSVDYELTGNELVALLKEADEIKRFMPPFNRTLRRKKYRFGIYTKYDDWGYHNLDVQLIGVQDEPVRPFTTRKMAEMTIMGLAEKHDLCLAKCGDKTLEDGCLHTFLPTESGPTKCAGACTGVEDVILYNQKVADALSKYYYSQPDFVIIGEGRRPDEHSIICVEKGKYLGLAYLDETVAEGGLGFDSLKEMVNQGYDSPDVHGIIRAYIKKKRKDTKVVYRG